MSKIIDNATSPTGQVVVKDPSKSSPSIVVRITGTATVNILQGENKGEMEIIDTITEGGIYEGAGTCSYVGAEVTEVSGSVSVSFKVV